MRELRQPHRQEPVDGVPACHALPGLQAARGAPLIASDATPDTAAPRELPRPRSTGLALGIAALAWALDVLTKQLAVHRLEGHAPVQVVGDFLQLTLVRNPGAAFSAGASFTAVISVVALVAAVVVTAYALRVRHRVWAVALGLLLAGVVGNLTDRLVRAPGPLRGHVVDFFQLPHWPVFNVADICINVAAVLFVVLLVRGIRLDGTRHHD